MKKVKSVKTLTWHDAQYDVPETRGKHYLVMGPSNEYPRVAYYDIIGDWFECLPFEIAFPIIRDSLIYILGEDQFEKMFGPIDDDLNECSEKLYKIYNRYELRLTDEPSLDIFWWMEIPPNPFEDTEDLAYEAGALDTYSILSEIEPILKKYISEARSAPPWIANKPVKK